MEAERGEPVSSECLAAQEQMALIPNYYRWVIGRFRPWIGTRILDVGSGIGNLVPQLPKPARLVLLDVSPTQCDEMRKRLGGTDGVEVVLQDVLAPSVLRLGRAAFDTIVCLDVLEHLGDDEKAFRHFYALLCRGGHLLVKVPAHPWLYGTMDEASGHYRRYTKRSIEALARAAGFAVLVISMMNRAGIPAWWLKGRVLKRRTNFSRTFSPETMRRMNRMIPIVKLVDRLLPLPVGLSLIAVLRKP